MAADARLPCFFVAARFRRCAFQRKEEASVSAFWLQKTPLSTKIETVIFLKETKRWNPREQFISRYRWPAERRQEHAVQCDHESGRGGGELPVLHDRAERRRRRRAGPAPRRTA